MGLSQHKNKLLWAFIGAVGFGVLATQTGFLGQIGGLPNKVTEKIANV